jgi:hypothetical protein
MMQVECHIVNSEVPARHLGARRPRFRRGSFALYATRARLGPSSKCRRVAGSAAHRLRLDAGMKGDRP